MKEFKLDGGSFIGADLRNMLLVYEGGDVPILTNARVDGSTWSLQGPAGATLIFLALLEACEPETVKKMFQTAREYIGTYGKPVRPH